MGVSTLRLAQGSNSALIDEPIATPAHAHCLVSIGTRYGPELLPQHAALLAQSAIDPEVARARGYRSITTRATLITLGFSRAQAQTQPGLLIPIWNIHGRLATYQLRPDRPRMVKGKVLKYETPLGTRMVLDVPPSGRALLGDPACRLFITEGARKADAAVSVGLCCIAVLGVWNWRGTNEQGGKTALSDWDSIALNGRQVYLAFDSDVVQKRSVYLALRRLKAYLQGHGALVHIIYLPAGPDGSKVGLDDFLAARS